ncbi:hypothetical protein [Hydrogenimonas thermophila]|uniref:Uncharacterized protein n=1 Tax=Hydrogenimonas thermophila TaxID=223786 RepID=A0A1I5R2L9_9BACT|nr:hypothetical protein [Hydrogenimonas thermophila]WOE69719.1 hypothetical protein RZR91_11500 [Hydrogenimonas thermophila]WOE72233.1 hypothetical protein RZR97_11490 [Hydrogenimonas thermophila]SFP52763.1 hypothetical protein SAMN05216234_12415 [Hydrogenimonas thermophila]
MRKAFGLMQAIMIILIMSGVALLTLKFATLQSKHYSDTFLKEQAELFLQSATEAALLEISGFDRNDHNSCIKNINIISPDSLFIAEMNISKYFLFNGKDNGGKDWPSNCRDRNKSIGYEDSHGMILLEAVVESNDSHPKIGNSKIRIVRRSLQRP